VLHDHHALTGQVASSGLPDVPIRQPMCTASFLGIEQVVVLLAPSSDFHFGGAVWFWAHPKCTVLVAEPVRLCGSGTIGCMAWFESGSTVLLAETPYFCSGGAAWMHTHCSWSTTTVFVAESACVCAGGAAWMHAHSPCIPTVFEAESTCVCFGGAAWMHAHSLCTPTTMLVAESACLCFGGAAWMHAHTSCTPTVLEAESTCLCFGGAAWMHAHTLCTPTVFDAEPPCVCVGGTPWHRAQPFGTVLVAALRPVHSHGGAVSNQAHPVRAVECARAPRSHLLDAPFNYAPLSLLRTSWPLLRRWQPSSRHRCCQPPPRQHLHPVTHNRE
jgi:hypothetical protein